MKGYLFERGIYPDYPCDIPDLKHPLINFENYQKWGAFRRWTLDVVSLIEKEKFGLEEVKAFDTYNEDCIHVFKFIVRLLNRDSSFPCSSCKLLSNRIRELFHNDYYLLCFEDKPELRLSGIFPGHYDPPVPNILHLKKYYDLSFPDNKNETIQCLSGEVLSTFMPCVYEMTSSKNSNELKSELQKLKNDLIHANEQVNFKTNSQKAITLYKASQLLLTYYQEYNHKVSGVFASYYRESPHKSTYNNCLLIQQLWKHFYYPSGKCIIPSMIIFEDYKKYYEDINEILTFNVNIALYFVKLLLCKFEDESFEEVQKIEADCIKNKPLAKNNINELQATKDTYSFNITFDKSVSDSSKNEIITDFFNRLGGAFKNDDILLQLKGYDAFCCSYYSKKAIIHFLFNNKMNQALELKNITASDKNASFRIIQGQVFYDDLKNNHDNPSGIEYLSDNSNLLVVFTQESQKQGISVRKMRLFIKKAISSISGLPEKTFIIEKQKMSWPYILMKYYQNRISRKQPEDEKINDRTFTVKEENAIYQLLNDFITLIKYKSTQSHTKMSYGDIEANFKYRECNIGNINELGAMIQKVLKSKRTTNLPEHYLKPTKRVRQSSQKSWFLSFTKEKHMPHNLCTLTVVFAFLTLFYLYEKVIDEKKIEKLIKNLKRAYKSQQNYEKIEKKTRGGIKYKNGNFFKKNFVDIYNSLFSAFNL